jgi:sugar lactone lactonase YvrE
VGTAASFYHPHGLAIDKNGNLYVADWGNHKVRKITQAGLVSTLAGSGIEGTANGTGSSASFSYPWGIAVDGNGNVYVGSYPNQIRKITPDGVVTTFAGSGSQGAADGPALSASFNNIHGLCIDVGGNLYVTDYTNNEIRKISSAGVVSTFAGSIQQGIDDGIGSAARFYNPEAITVDKDGNLFITDWDNETIRKITPAGMVSIIAGVAGYRGGDDGPGSTASFYSPSGIAVGANGNIFIGDPGNNKVRKLTPQVY